MPRNRNAGPAKAPLEGKALAEVANRLKSARGHLDHVIRIVESEGYPIEAMRQLAAVRGALENTVRMLLRYYFEHAFVAAVKNNDEAAASEELTHALRFMNE